VTRTLARAAAIGALVFSLTAMTVALIVSATQADEIPSGTIVVVGSCPSPGMQEVVTELEQRVAEGQELRATLVLDFSAIVIAVLVLLWIGVGAVIVWRQPGNWAGWLFLITGTAVPMYLLASAVVVPNHLTFAVSDDGAGFDVVAALQGTGLQGMTDRVEAVGGRLEVDSAPGRGTTVTGAIPVEVAS